MSSDLDHHGEISACQTALAGGLPRIRPLLGGREYSGAGGEIDIINPATGSPMGILEQASEGQVQATVHSATQAFESGVWSRAPWAVRQRWLRSSAKSIREHASELASLQCRESGLPLATVHRQIGGAALWFDYFADYLGVEAGRSYRQLGNATTMVLREPLGVCALFSPWNVPIGLSAIKLAPCLAAGNSAILKPSEFTPMAPRLLVDLLQACGLPEGVLSCVNGAGHVTGDALAKADGVDMISFTGGATAGAAVATHAARRHLPCVLELGGKSATIIFDDADFDAAVEGALQSAYGNNGEACLAGSRILLQSGIAERFMQAFCERARRMRMGDPMDRNIEIGPMISAQHRDRVRSFFETCERDGDQHLCGGPDDAVPASGYFVVPSAYRVASRRSRLWREEVFGPIAAFDTFTEEADAAVLANDSNYGLVAYVWTRDFARAMRISHAVRAGTLLVNTPMRRELNAPFGGYKASGVGREGGEHSWNNFTQAKTIVLEHGVI